MFSSKEKENETQPLFRLCLRSDRVIKNGGESFLLPVKPGHYKIVAQNRSKNPLNIQTFINDKLEAKGGMDEDWGIIAHIPDKKKSKYQIVVKIIGENGSPVTLSVYQATKAYNLEYTKEGESIEYCKSLDL